MVVLPNSFRKMVTMDFLNHSLLTRDPEMLRVGDGVGAGGQYPSTDLDISQGVHYDQNVVSGSKVGNKHIVRVHLAMS